MDVVLISSLLPLIFIEVAPKDELFSINNSCDIDAELLVFFKYIRVFHLGSAPIPILPSESIKKLSFVVALSLSSLNVNEKQQR